MQYLFVLMAVVLFAVPEPPTSPINMNGAPPVRGAYQPRVAFEQGRVVTIKSYNTSKPIVVIQGPGREQTATGDFSGLSRNSLIFHRGRFWALSAFREPQASWKVEFKSSVDGHSWETQGFFTQASSRFRPEIVLPLEDGYVFGVHSQAVGDQEPTSFLEFIAGMERGYSNFFVKVPWG